MNKVQRKPVDSTTIDLFKGYRCTVFREDNPVALQLILCGWDEATQSPLLSTDGKGKGKPYDSHMVHLDKYQFSLNIEVVEKLEEDTPQTVVKKNEGVDKVAVKNPTEVVDKPVDKKDDVQTKELQPKKQPVDKKNVIIF